MKVLLRNARNGTYFAGNSLWLHDDAPAMNFPDVERAVRFNLEEQLGATEIVLILENPRRSLSLPITSTSGPSARRKLISRVTTVH